MNQNFSAKAGLEELKESKQNLVRIQIFGDP